MNIGEVIREERKRRGLSQIELANRAGIAVNSLRLYEANKRSPNLKTAQKIADGIGISIDELLGWKRQEYLDIGLATLGIAKDVLKDYPQFSDECTKSCLYRIIEHSFTVGYNIGYKDGERTKATE